ncbi:MAG: hypothetical protein MAG581_02007 [Deltaproteobacteria bacterium]|jgi:hypothetical protein|nr:hypothetical protein [Deltaproteobacteria bacterium]
MQIIIFILLLTGLLVQAESIFAKESFRSELLSGSKSSFKHWNLKHSEITGHSHYSHLEVTKDGKTFIVEKNENTKPDGEVFTRKTLWFDADSGVPKWYEEEDLRKDFRIINTYSGKVMNTKLEKSGDVLEFETDLSKEEAVPFEVIIYFLRKHLDRILQTEDYSFTLFLPLLALELEEKGLPRSMSMILMMVEPKEKFSIDTPLGKMKARKILILPKSGFLRAILPREKTHFEFTFSEDAPHHLLQFEAGETRHLLTKLILPE